MSKQSTHRKQMQQRLAAQLAARGKTHRQIAEILGCKPEQVKTHVDLGKRLLGLDIGGTDGRR